MRKLTQTQVEQRYLKSKLQLIDKYIHSKVLLRTICHCGNEFLSKPNHVFTGHTTSCGCIYILSRTKENHHGWNPNLSNEDRIKGRKSPEDTSWIKKVNKRDNYTCVICNIKSRINTHHLYGYSDYPLLRYEVSNGVTLCASSKKLNTKGCHEKFHTMYGKIDNTKEQFEEFKDICQSHPVLVKYLFL